MKSLVLLFSILLLISTGQTQVLTNFDMDSLDNWRSEGDGKYYFEADSGNPGGCMRIDDDATGDLNIAIAPLQFLGDWSAADTTDSLMCDVFVGRLSGSFTTNLWVFRISGPGGRATSPAFTPDLGSWDHIAFPMDSTAWTINSGTWSGLLAKVNLMEVRAEYINGDEFVRLDNIGMTFSPQVLPVEPPVVSHFEQGTYDGWTFLNSGGTSIPASGGNPGRYIRITDASGVTQALAPPKFLGDWSNLDNQAAIVFDLKISNFSGSFYQDDFLIKLSGPGGIASLPVDSTLIAAFNEWHTFSFLLKAENWTIESGSWNAILADVRELRMVVEFINGSEIVWFDNFRISNSKPLADFFADPVFIFPGDSVQFTDASTLAPLVWEWNFGDGTTSTDPNPSHTYTEPGIYNVELIVSNLFGSDTLHKPDYIEVASITDSILYQDDFDDNQIHPAWRFKNGTWQEKNGEMAQTSNYYSGSYLGGCYAIVGSPEWKNYRLQVDFKSTDNDKIGVVFNYADENNFYLFTWQAEGTHRAVKKFIDGDWTDIVADTIAYTGSQWYHLDIISNNGSISVKIDSVEVFAFVDSTYLKGKVGLYCHGNQSSFWDNFKVENLDFISTDIRLVTKNVPKKYYLRPNYPNPFNPVTNISFTLPVKELVNLSIYNMLGQRVLVLIDKEMAGGDYSYTFDASALPSGTYIYQLRAGSFVQSRKMVLLK